MQLSLGEALINRERIGPGWVWDLALAAVRIMEPRHGAPDVQGLGWRRASGVEVRLASTRGHEHRRSMVHFIGREIGFHTDL